MTGGYSVFIGLPILVHLKNRHMKQIAYACSALLFLLSACTGNKEQKTDILAANVDTTVSPATDFFLFANGGWIKRNPIPASESS